MKHLPAFRAAIAAAIGIAIGKEYAPYQLIFLSVAIVLFIVSSGWLTIGRKAVSGLPAAGIYAALSLAFAFYMSTNLAAVNPTNLSHFRYFTGTVEEAPRDTSAASAKLTDCFGYDNGWKKIDGHLVLTPKFRMDLKTKDRIVFAGKAGNVSEARNPGEFNLKSYYELNGIVGRLYVVKRKDILSLCHDDGVNVRRNLIEPIRNFFRSKIKMFMSGDEAELARAMLIGERMGINESISEQFVNSGTVHILSVSGLHIGFFTAILMMIASLVRIPRRFRFFVIAPCLLLYAVVVGTVPSVTRAVLMAIVVLFGLFLQRRSNVLNSLGFAALVILTASPSQLFSPGFQLSFAAVLSIAFFYERILGMVHKRYPTLTERPLANSITSLSILTAAATLGTIPLTVYYFSRVSLVSILANLLIVPMSGLFTTMSFAFVFFSLISTPLASIYGAAAQLLGFSILQINSVLGSLGVSSARIGEPGLGFVLLYLFWLVAVAGFGKDILWKKAVLAILLGSNILLYSNLMHGKPEARVFVLDVGQGDAIYVELPNGRNMLVDAGMKFGGYDSGERVILPFLEKRGVKELNYFVITHLHSDHIGGAVSILRKLKVRRFIYSDQHSLSKTWTNTMSSVRALGVPTETAMAGLVLDSGAVHRVYVLHPNRRYVGTGGSSYRTRLNNGSIVLKVCVGDESIILTGDVESHVESEIVRHYGRFLAASVYKAGHHGARTSSSEEFVDAIHPSYAVISVGSGNRFGHPSSEVLDRLSRHNISLLRTDSTGAACFCLNTDTTEVIQWR
ncbi:MAG: DNA internalization-related competence protein ComEC/Rec2 [Bacteroidetes bacterium]|nr:DNA internalization-related competence protein ComEC/Rec2 [Bacteroidota bacterium]